MIFLAPLPQTPPAVGAPAPDVVFRKPDGSPFRLSSLHGKMVVIEFTAYACPPCRVLAPKLEAFAKTFPNVVFLTVSTGPEGELAALTAMRGKNAPTTLLKDPYHEDRSKMAVWRFGNVGTPTMFLITSDGKIASQPMQGGDSDLAHLRSRINWVIQRGIGKIPGR